VKVDRKKTVDRIGADMNWFFREDIRVRNIIFGIAVLVLANFLLTDDTSISLEVNDQYFVKGEGYFIGYDYGNEFRTSDASSISILSQRTVLSHSRNHASTLFPFFPTRVNLSIQPPENRKLNHVSFKLIIYKRAWFMTDKKCSEYQFVKTDAQNSYSSFYCSKPWWAL
jgi:hypothetical protein